MPTRVQLISLFSLQLRHNNDAEAREHLDAFFDKYIL